MNPSVSQSASRPMSPSVPASSQPVQSPKPQASAAPRPVAPGGRDEFVSGGKDRTATTEGTSKVGARNQMTTGKITINGHTYTYRSGGFGKGNLPKGDYKVTPHMWNRNTKGMVVDGVGFSFALSDKFDPRVGETRSLLRIHPDGGTP